MVSSSPSPRGFESAEADEAAREAARAEARRYRAESISSVPPTRARPSARRTAASEEPKTRNEDRDTRLTVELPKLTKMDGFFF